MKQFVIIGNSAAGIAAVEAIRQKDKISKIIVISDENYPAYCRCLISYYLAGDIEEKKILYRAEDFYKENNIELLLSKKVIHIEPEKNRIICQDKTQLSYDSLLIATGASAKFPRDIKGVNRKGVFAFRTLKDADDIKNLLGVTKTVCILGGGLIGLKAACALSRKNIEVKVIVKSNQILSQMLDFESAAFVQKKMGGHGLEIILGQDVTEVMGERDIKGVKLESGKVLVSSLVIMGKGVSPNMDLVTNTKIKVKEGIIANNFMQTNVLNIYTAGDVCESFDLTRGESSINALWPIAVEQGRIAGLNMAGENVQYQGTLGMNSLEFFGLPIISLGIHKACPVRNSGVSKNTGGCEREDAREVSNGVRQGQLPVEEIKIVHPEKNLYKKLIIKDNIIAGAIFIGDIRNSGVYLSLIKGKVNISVLKDKLLAENFNYPDIIEFLRQKEKIYV